MTSPGPGRRRPDSTAMGGSIGIWGGTFAGSPGWDTGPDCGGQALRFSVAPRANPVAIIWSARLDPGSGEDQASVLTTHVLVDGGTERTITVSVVQ